MRLRAGVWGGFNLLASVAVQRLMDKYVENDWLIWGATAGVFLLLFVVEYLWSRRWPQASDGGLTQESGGDNRDVTQQQNTGAVGGSMVGGDQHNTTTTNNYAPVDDRRPRLLVSPQGGTVDQRRFAPSWKVEHTGGDLPEWLAWRARMAEFTPGDWRPVPVSELRRNRGHTIGMPETDVSGAADQDQEIPAGHIALELRFLWNDVFHHDRHIYPITRGLTGPGVDPPRTHIERGQEIPPVKKWVEEPTHQSTPDTSSGLP